MGKEESETRRTLRDECHRETERPNQKEEEMKQIDPKYKIKAEGRGFIKIEIVNGSDVPIPDDEPLMLFRARDRNALAMLEEYRRLCVLDNCTDFHMAGIQNRIQAFRAFAEQHPERMKQPGVTKGK